MKATDKKTRSKASKKAALYLRVSTDGQTVKNQRNDLEEVAARNGWQVVDVYSDAGISGAKSRHHRPGLDDLLNNLDKYDVVMAWSVDRVGRSMIDLVSFMQDLKGSDTDLYLHKQHLDTTTPTGRMMYNILAAFAEYERDIITERVNAGLKRAWAEGKKSGRRPQIDEFLREDIQALVIDEGKKYREVSDMTGISIASISRIVNNKQGAAA